MSDKTKEMERRKFLRAGGAGLAALASRRLWVAWPDGSGVSERQAPTNPVTLRSSRLEVILDQTDGVPFAYRMLPGNARLRGDDSGQPITATICDRAAWKFAAIPVSASGVRAHPREAVFHFAASSEGRPAAQFSVRYALENSGMQVTLEDVQEHAGFELIEVVLPPLATVREEDGEAWLAHGDDGGALTMLRDARPCEFPANTFWGHVMASLPVVMIGTENVLCLQETTAYMDSTLLGVAGEAGKRRASIGTVQNYRVNGSQCYDMNLGRGAARNCGTAKTPNLLIGQKPSCRLDFVTPAAGKAKVDWLDGAKIVSSRMPAIPTDFYKGKFVYGIRCDEPKFEKPAATFKDCQLVIRDIAALTGSSPQIAHLWGWQYRGKDTGYPAVAEVNQRVGGLEGLRELLAEGPKHGCTVTFSDNYDDAYRSSPAWDPAIIARRPDGELWLSRNWTGEDSYIIGLAKYMAGPGPERVRYTCRHYGIRDTIHVDVLSYFTVRDDWDPQHPASGIKNLFEGRYKVVEEFKKHGVDVSSEAMRYAAIGKISFFWHIASAKPCPFGGQPIPLQPMIYRKSAIWGEGSSQGALVDRIMNTLFYNGCMHWISRADLDRKDITDLYYLNLVPWFKVQNRQIESFQRNGERTVIGLEGNSRIEQDWGAKTYSVSVDEVEIARDLATFCPLDGERIAFYAHTERPLSAPVPKTWKQNEMIGLALLPEKAEPFPVEVGDGRVHMQAPARQPVLVYANRAAAENHHSRT